METLGMYIRLVGNFAPLGSIAVIDTLMSFGC